MRILVVEDDPEISRFLVRGLTEERHSVVLRTDGHHVAELAAADEFDAIVLDIMLPGPDGFTVCRALRRAGIDTPVIMVTARDDVHDRVTGLDEGADDYLTKPFSPKELMARIRAVLRRRAPEALDSAVEIAGLRLDPATRRVTRTVDGQPREVRIGPTEFRLLHFLMTHPERVHSRAQLLDRVWGDHVFIEERTVDVHVKRLREALAPVHCSALVETVRGAGYRMTQQLAAPAGSAGP